jgi:ADP-ribose pyrophosphatase
VDKRYELLSKEVGFQGFFRVDTMQVRHTLFEGGWSKPLERELFQRGECVAAVLYDGIRDQLVLIEQFRGGAMQYVDTPWLLEIVAGAIEPGETPEQVVIRETQEEAGCEVLDLISAHVFYTTPGGSSERIHLFCARVDSANVGGIHGLRAEDEDIRVFVVGFDEAMALLNDGKIASGIPLVGLYWLAQHRKQLRLQWGSTAEEGDEAAQSDAGC